MYLENLKLKNIGPFKEVNLSFCDEGQESIKLENIITGLNGSGKSILLEAIVAILKGIHFEGKREIVSGDDFLIEAIFKKNDEAIKISSSRRNPSGGFKTQSQEISSLFAFDSDDAGIVDWLICYWNSNETNSEYSISNLSCPKSNEFLKDCLDGEVENIKLTEYITYFDYLKSSDDPNEAQMGKFIFTVMKEMVRDSIINGELKYVSRKTLLPIFEIEGEEISLEKLSSGNLYILKRLIVLLGKMYSLAILNNKGIGDVLNTKGILIIDEVENHLHPSWQKKFLPNVRKYFPNLQIIVTTHSPFVVNSLQNPNIIVCNRVKNESYISNESDLLSNMPIEEILLTPVFNTDSFSIEISNLLVNRKEAIRSGNNDKLQEINKKLIELNPEYFSYINMEQKIKNVL